MSDLFGGRRAVVIGTFMCALIVFLAVFALYSEAGLGPAPLLFMLACMGILVGGYVAHHVMMSYHVMSSVFRARAIHS